VKDDPITLAALPVDTLKIDRWSRASTVVTPAERSSRLLSISANRSG
jgi:hypothetical protein